MLRHFNGRLRQRFRHLRATHQVLRAALTPPWRKSVCRPFSRFTISGCLRSCLRQQPGRERNADIPSELQDCGRTGSSMRIQIRLRPILVWAIGLMVAGAIAWWIAMRFLVLTD